MGPVVDEEVTFGVTNCCQFPIAFNRINLFLEFLPGRDSLFLHQIILFVRYIPMCVSNVFLNGEILFVESIDATARIATKDSSISVMFVGSD